MEKIFENPFKAALKGDRPTFGVWMDTTSPYLAEIAATCGYDWMLFDGEHAPNTLQTMLQQMQAVTAYDTHPIVRLVEGSAAGIKHILDIGVKSVMIPMVETEAQAAAMVSAMRYPPGGVRGAGAAVGRATRWNRAPDYMQRVEESLCLVLQAESPRALDNLDAITALDGVDGIFIGPIDLATEMGFQGDITRPEVQAAVESGIKRIRANGKGAGVFAMNPEFADRCIAWGANMVAIACDALAYVEILEAKLARFKR